jgi:cellulose synthase/poly-beta-1,6-N-acetylglucosamine synthase-like glycosyltransferase
MTDTVIAPTATKADEVADTHEPTITVIVPAFNEQDNIADTIESLLRQTRPADHIIVVDDCSTDRTGEIARSYTDRGVIVLQPPENLGSKAKAQNFALPFVTTELVLPIDGDTELATDYIALLVPVFRDPQVAVASGCVLTKRQDTIWEKARQLEYLLGFHWYRTIQQMAGSVTVCSGCCTVFRRDLLSEGFPETTLTEDIFYTWEQHIAKRKAVYVADAVARAAEPESLKYLSKQLKRWKCGWFHGFRMQYGRLLRNRPMVALWAGLQFLETVLAPLIIVLPILMFFVWHSPALNILEWWALGDLVTFWPPVLYGCWKRKYSPLKAILSYPAWYLLKAVNFRWDMHMMVRELVLVPLGICKPFTTYERGKA